MMPAGVYGMAWMITSRPFAVRVLLPSGRRNDALVDEPAVFEHRDPPEPIDGIRLLHHGPHGRRVGDGYERPAIRAPHLMHGDARYAPPCGADQPGGHRDHGVTDRTVGVRVRALRAAGNATFGGGDVRQG